MTDITELAQREKFEAWWERTQHNGNPPRFGWSHWRDGEGYKVDDDDSELEGMWSAWKAAGAELVEALEKSEKTSEARREAIDRTHNMFVRERDRANAAEEALEKAQQRITQLESRTVKLPDLRQIVSGDRYVWSDGVYNYSQDVKVALAAAGIKVEDE